MPKKKQKETNHFQTTIFILVGILILLHFLASFFPQARIWGFNLLAFFPLWFRILCTLIPLLFLIPSLNRALTDFLFISRKNFPFDKRRFFYYAIFSLFSILIFWLLRTKTYFLGDGYLVTRHIESPYLFLKWSEPLDLWVHFKLYHYINNITAISGASIFAWVSIISGAIFVFLSFYLSELLGESKRERFFVFGSFLTMGIIELFFGYAEVYTLVTLTIFAYLVFSLRYLKKGGNLILPLLFLLVSLPLHFQSIYLFPSLLFLFLSARTKKGENPQKRKKKNYLILTVLCILAVIVLLI
jgi:hypothetical protein